MSASVVVAFVCTVLAAVGTGVLVGRCVRAPRTDLFAWSCAAAGLTVALGAQAAGYASGFGSATFRIVAIGAQLVAPLWLAWGLVELAARGGVVRFGAKLVTAALTFVAAVVLITDPLSSTAFGKSWPPASAHYQIIPKSLLTLVAGVSAVIVVIALAVTAARARLDPAWRRPLIAAAAASAAVLAVLALRFNLPVNSGYAALCLAGAALTWFAGTRADAIDLEELREEAAPATGRGARGRSAGPAEPEPSGNGYQPYLEATGDIFGDNRWYRPAPSARHAGEHQPDATYPANGEYEPNGEYPHESGYQSTDDYAGHAGHAGGAGYAEGPGYAGDDYTGHAGGPGYAADDYAGHAGHAGGAGYAEDPRYAADDYAGHAGGPGYAATPDYPGDAYPSNGTQRPDDAYWPGGGDDMNGRYGEDFGYDPEEGFEPERDWRREAARGGIWRPRGPDREAALSPAPDPAGEEPAEGAALAAVGGTGDSGDSQRTYGLIAIYTLAENRVGNFDALAARVVDEVRTSEPDTLVYAVHTVPNAPMQRIFYEVYRDKGAHEEHRRQRHIQRFEAERAPYVMATNVIELGVQQAKLAGMPGLTELLGRAPGQ